MAKRRTYFEVAAGQELTAISAPAAKCVYGVLAPE